MLATQMPYECGAKMLWCAAASFSSALAFCTGFFGKMIPDDFGYSSSSSHSIAFGAMLIVRRNAANSGEGFTVNVAHADKRCISELDHRPHQMY